MKRRFITMVAVMGLLVAGCGTTSDERIAVLKSGIDRAAALSAEADKYIAILDAQLIEADTMLATTDGDPDATEKIRGVIATIQDEKARAAVKKSAVDQAVAQWKLQIDAITAQGSANIGTELQVIGTGISTAAPIAPGPAAGYLYLVGALLTAFGAGVGKVYQSRKDSPVIQALPEVIKGVNDILDQVTTTPDAVNQAKALLMLRQSAQTQAIVSEIKTQ
jgi:hypothetical protein